VLQLGRARLRPAPKLFLKVAPVKTDDVTGANLNQAFTIKRQS
jgi:hypothetical protein